MTCKGGCGRPTVERVREHAYGIGGWGLWRYNRLNGAVGFVRLRIGVDGGVEASDGPFLGWYTLECDGCCDWTPCDQQGNPVGLVDRCEYLSNEVSCLREEIADLRDKMDTDADELDAALASENSLQDECDALHHRLRQVRDLALRLVKEVRHWAQAWKDEVDDRC